MSKVNALKFGGEAKKKLLSGVDMVNDAVKITMGPKGRTVLMATGFGSPKVTKDGVTVAKAIESKDKFEQLGVQVVQGTVTACADKVEDGSSTVTVVTCSAVKDVLLCPSPFNKIEVIDGIHRAKDAIIKHLKEHSIPLDSHEKVFHVANVASNYNTAIATVMTDAVKYTGSADFITLEESKDVDTQLKLQEGYKLSKGITTHAYITDRKNCTANLSNGLVVIYDGKVSAYQDILPILELCAKESKAVFLYAELDGEAKSTAAINRHLHQLQLVVLEPAGFGDNRTEIMEDLAVMCGATVLRQDRDERLKDVTKAHMGRFTTLRADKEQTLVTCDSSSELVRERIEAIENQLKNTTSQWEKEKLQGRLGNLKSKAAVVYLGASTDIMVKELRDVAEDVLGGIRAAEKDGIIIGGGCALLRAIQATDPFVEDDKLTSGERYGIEIMRRAVSTVSVAILDNAGLKSDVIIENLIRDGKSNPNLGFDVHKGQAVDMYKAGIIDSTLSSVKATEYAGNTACMVANIELLGVKEKTKDDEHQSPSVPGGGGMNMGGGPGFM